MNYMHEILLALWLLDSNLLHLRTSGGIPNRQPQVEGEPVEPARSHGESP